MYLNVKFIVITLIIFAVSCVEKPEEVTTLGGIYGVVSDDSNNNFLSDAIVNIQTIGNRVTLNDGAYLFEDLQEDIYAVSASKTGYVTETEQIEVVSNSFVEVNFSLRIAQPAELYVSPQSLNFGQTQVDLQISIDNAGDEELSWQVSSDQSWLTTFPTTGTTTSETDQISVSVNRSLLPVGFYDGNLFFTSNGGNFNIPVAMEVTPVGLILSQNNLDFGEDSTNMSFVISNSGNSELNYEIINTDSWVDVNPNFGTITTDSDVINVSINRGGLVPGEYNSVLSVESNGGNQSVFVEMIVPEGPAPDLSVSTNNLDFGAESDNMSFNIFNSGEETLTWSVSTNESWISIFPTSGSCTTETDQISVSIDRSNFDVGSHTGIINITSNGGSESILVNLSVPFVEDFSDFNIWANDGWNISNSWNCYEAPCASFYTTYNGEVVSEMSTNVQVTDGQILSLWAKVYSPSGIIELRLNNTLVWSQNGYGTSNPSFELSGDGNLNIKIKAYGPELSSGYIDNLIIE